MTLTAPRAVLAAGMTDASAPRRAAVSVPGVRPAWVAVAAIAAVGVCLRLAAARGDLWLDELWSLDLVSRISSPDQVFWNIPHDNNHFLNSLWIFLVGQTAAPLVYRLPSIVFGTATILVASRIAGRVNAAAAVAAAALAATSYALIDYGSEARGYGGLILAIFLSIDLTMRAIERLVAAPAVPVARARRDRWVIAGVILFGTCSHLTMLVEGAVLAATTTARLIAAGWSLRAALDATVALFRPSLLLVVPVLAALGVGASLHQGFTVGGFMPFSVANYLHGYGGLVLMLLGLPPWLPNGLGLLVAATLIAGAFGAGLLDRRWLPLALTAAVVWPAVVLAARVPNTDYARYFLTAGLVVPLFVAEIAGRLWARGRAARMVAVAGVAAICAGQVPSVRELILQNRGSPGAAVALMASDGPATFVARNAAITDPVVDVYATRLGADLKPGVWADRCRLPPRWVIFDADYGEPAPAAPRLDGPGCTLRYTRVADYPAALWSGRSWTLYRFVP